MVQAKLELKLEKLVPGKWERLEGDGTGGATAFNTAAASDTAPRTVYSVIYARTRPSTTLKIVVRTRTVTSLLRARGATGTPLTAR